MSIGFTTNKAWFDKAFVAIAPVAGTDVEIRTVANSFSRSGGGAGFESLEVFGGKISKPQVREDIELSFDGIVASPRDFDWIFHGTTSTASSISTWATPKYRVSALWTDATGITSAAQAVTSGNEAYRQIFAGCQATGLEYNFDAGEHLTATLSFSLATEDETGSSNVKVEACAPTGFGQATLGSVPSYTTSVKW